MRDSSLSQYIAQLEYDMYGTVSPEHLYATVMDSTTAGAIQSAAYFAFVGRFGEAEQCRLRGGYDGLGLIDGGAVRAESESAREGFRRALDADDFDQ